MGVLTVAIMNQFNITKGQAVKAAQAAAQTAKDKGPDAARQAAAATADAAKIAGQKTIEYVDKVSKDPRASPGMKKFFTNLAVVLKPQDLENETTVQQRVKQITDKTAGPVKPAQQQRDSKIVDAEFEEEPT